MTANDAGGRPGYYLFSNLTSGDYRVWFELPTGLKLTQAEAPGTTAESDSNKLENGYTSPIDIGALVGRIVDRHRAGISGSAGSSDTDTITIVGTIVGTITDTVVGTVMDTDTGNNTSTGANTITNTGVDAERRADATTCNTDAETDAETNGLTSAWRKPSSKSGEEYNQANVD